VERGSDKVSPLHDEQLKAEERGLLQSGRQTHTEEWRQVEPSGEDEPDVDRFPDGTMAGGTPEGMTADDVEGRSEIARYIGKELYPAVREQLIQAAMDRNAPDRVVDELRRLPSGRTFENASEVWETLGGHTESQRF
jgi:hypothetical protein